MDLLLHNPCILPCHTKAGKVKGRMLESRPVLQIRTGINHGKMYGDSASKPIGFGLVWFSHRIWELHHQGKLCCTDESTKDEKVLSAD